ncbi:MAG: hypothetical protein BroJett018_06080 [Chloroflexota bacterium]|nr:hypothetical protein [Chloroflexota bacterium]NOG63004.1 hypothetical protein [Chloroflexota bacterium]GIK62814.1 MAG: hypothetical protein BroJett018_06080 [Chloroflexota bacterium]
MSKYSYGRNRGPAPITVMLIAAILVFGGYMLWTGLVNFLEEGGRKTIAEATEQAHATSTAENRPTLIIFPSYTPLPPCQIFFVNVTSANVRECPEFSCRGKTIVRYEGEVCVYGRANPAEFPNADAPDEWFVVNLTPNDAFPDYGYMHESVLEARYPTARPTRTFTPLPTITLTPTPRYTQTPIASPANTETFTPSPTTPAAPPTSAEIEF